MTITLSRTVGTSTVPAAGTYSIDASHSVVEFSVRHLGLSKTRGRFNAFEGTIDIAEDPTDSRVDVSIDAASFDSGNEDRDTHVKNEDFLDVEQFPHLTFSTTGVRQDKSKWLVDGNLSIHGVTQPVTLTTDFEGTETDPWGGGRIAFSAKTEINREDFDISFNQVLDGGGLLIGKQVKISIEVEAVRT